MNVERSPITSGLERWEQLFFEQSSIFRDALNRSAELENEVEELRRELSVWKAGYKTAEDEKKALEKAVTKLERSIDAMKDDNPVIFCVIDGDGTIFSQDLWPLGRPGGRQAAMLLAKGLSDHAANMDDGRSTRCQIWLGIFCNKGGLKETLLGNEICTGEEFEDFIHGFNQASPLFSIVDVGAGKEAADSKIKEHLRVFSRFPQTARIYFGGAHDNGYSTTLNFLENEGLLEKIVLLRGYKNLAFELKDFDLPHLEIDGLFMTHKLQAAHTRYYSSSPVKQPIHLYEQDNLRSDDKYTPEERTRGSTPKFIDPSLPLAKHKPPPCTWHYLTKCRMGPKCRFGHDYVVTPETMAILRVNAKRSPCQAVANDQTCPDGDRCLLGHYCPKGSKCGFVKAGRCKFTGKDSHKLPTGSRQHENLTLFNEHTRGSTVPIFMGAMRVADDSASDQPSSSTSPSEKNAQLPGMTEYGNGCF